LTKGRIAAAHVRFSGIRQMAPVYPRRNTFLDPPESTTQWHFGQFSHFCTAHGKVSSGMPGISFPLKIAHWHAAIWSGPRLIHGSLGPPESTPKRHLDRFRHFCTAHGSESLYFTTGHPLPLKAACSHGASEPHLIHGSLGGGPIRVLNPNGISIGPAVLEVSLL